MLEATEAILTFEEVATIIIAEILGKLHNDTSSIRSTSQVQKGT